jgi:hypothetical protein
MIVRRFRGLFGNSRRGRRSYGFINQEYKSTNAPVFLQQYIYRQNINPGAYGVACSGSSSQI